MVPFVIRPTRSPARAARHVDRLRHHLVIQPAAGRPLAERRRHALRQLLFAWPSARDATAAAVPGSRKLACCPRTPAIPQPCRRELPPSKPPASATKHHLSSRLPPKGCPRSTQARPARFAAVQLIACGKSGGETFPLSVGFSSLRGLISADTRSPALHGIIDAGSPAPHCTIITSLAAPGTATRGCNTGPLIAVSVSIQRLYERFF